MVSAGLMLSRQGPCGLPALRAAKSRPTPRRRPGLGGAERRQPTWPLAAQHEPRAQHRLIQCLLHLARPSFSRGSSADLIHRTAVYGPVRTVVWEGRSREAPTIPVSYTHLTL